MIKTIIFDYAGVITPTKDKSNFAKENHKRFGMEYSELMDILYKNWDKATVGKISYKQYWKELGEKLNTDPEEIKNLTIDTFPVDNRIIELIDKIKDRYTIVMLSNQIEDWLEKVIDDNFLRDKFHYFINSYHVEAKKPDKKIFIAALKRSGSKPEETLFIDDSIVNIAAAKQLGMHTIQFHTYKQFIREFKKYSEYHLPGGLN